MSPIDDGAGGVNDYAETKTVQSDGERGIGSPAQAASVVPHERGKGCGRKPHRHGLDGNDVDDGISHEISVVWAHIYTPFLFDGGEKTLNYPANLWTHFDVDVYDGEIVPSVLTFLTCDRPDVEMTLNATSHDAIGPERETGILIQ